MTGRGCFPHNGEGTGQHALELLLCSLSESRLQGRGTDGVEGSTQTLLLIELTDLGCAVVFAGPELLRPLGILPSLGTALPPSL